ncbi:MAG: histidine phosphatase family protein [Sideroxydans sp.]|nr:histidine phosphatase family protein [Sideroxydans sp.]
MELILWRHAEAEDGVPDIGRALTGKGHKQAEKMAAFLRSRLPQDTRILVSPAKRTQQTVHALTKYFDTEPAIAPGAAPRAILDTAGWPEAGGSVLVVGHQPSLGQTAAMLLGEPATCFSVKKGSVWWLSRREREGDFQTNLRLVISPEFL